MLTCALTVSLLAASPSWSAVPLPPSARRLFDHGAWVQTPGGFRIIALSHLADGCASDWATTPAHRAEARACVERAIGVARGLTHQAPELHQDGLFLTHFNLLLGAADATGGCPDAAEHERLSRRLAELSMAEPLAHVASYASTRLRWPADQAATLASLRRYDQAHRAQLVQAPLAKWRAVLARRGVSARWSLPKSEMTGRGVGAEHPRGCAQSFISRYLAEVDLSLSAAWWANYRKHFLVHVGPVTGFREWPPGVDGAADSDSGPIVLGIGVSASALGISAARAQGDEALAAQLERSQAIALATGAGGGVEHSTLAEAIAFQARRQRAALGNEQTPGGKKPAGGTPKP